MKNKMRRIETLSFYDHTGIEKHLAKMAKKGWMIEQITTQFWTYRKIEPQEYQFAVTYYPKATDFDPAPSDTQQTFYDFCTRTGWELACSWFQMQIFYNISENPIPIDTDPVYEVETIHKACKKNYLRGYFLLLILGAVGTYFLYSGLVGHTLHFFSSPSNMVTYPLAFLLFLLCAVELLTYFSWHKKAAKAAQDGIFMDTPSTAVYQKTILVALVVLILFWIINLISGNNPLLAVVTVLVFTAIFLTKVSVNAVKQFLKRKKIPAGLNRVLTVFTSFLVAFVLMGTAITIGTLISKNEAFSQSLRIEETPLKVEDLMDTSYQGYITLTSPDTSLMLSRLEVEQRHHFDDEPSAEIPHLEYDIYKVNIPALYDFFESQMKRTALLGYDDARLIEVNSDLFGAVNAYQITGANGEPFDRYVLCYTDTLVDIEFNWSLTKAQMSIVAEKLSGN